MTRGAGKLCAAGETEKARAALGELHAAVAARYGPGHEATRLVGLYAGAEATGDEAAEEPLPAELQRALKKLRACTPAPTASAPRSIDEEITSDQHLGVALKLYERGLYSQALEAAELAREVADPDAEPAAMLRLHDVLAKIQLQLGHREEAFREAAVAEKLAAKTGAVRNRIDYARLYAQAGDLERAAAALARLEDEAKDPAERAEYEEVQGFLALRLGSPREALDHLERALRGHRKAYGTDHPYTAAVHQLRGDAYRLAGDFPAAIEAYRETLRLRRAVLGPEHAETARTQNAIGVLQADLGDWRNADGAFRAALETLRETQGEESVDTITVRTNRALAAWGSRKDREAADQYAAALADLRRALGDDHASVAAGVRNLARMEFDLGNGARAQQLLDEALAAQTRVLGASHPDLAPTRLARGRLLARQGKLPESAAEIDRAIEVLLGALGPEHPLVARARTTRARTAIAQGDYATALQSAAAAARAIAVFSRRTFGAISDRQRALLSQDSQDVIGALLSVPDTDARDLFLVLLPHRDSVLRSIAARRSSERGGPYAGQLEDLRRRYVAAVLGEGPGTAERVRELAQAIEGLEALQSAEGGGLLPASDSGEVLAAACKRLPDDAALVKLVAFDRTPMGRPTETVPAYTALVVKGGGCDVARVELGDGDAIQRAAEAFATAMRDQRMDEPVARVELSKLLLEPIQAAVGGASRWLVVPDGSLWGIPIGVLPDPKDSERYLLERVTVGYLTSSYELAETDGGGGPSEALRRSLLVGAPDFGSGRGPVVVTDQGPCQVSPFERLPATSRELEDIAELLEEPRQLVGGEVTKQRLEQELRNHPSVVHFATHAYFAGTAGCGTGRDGDDDLRERAIAPNPLLLSGIVLAGANQPARVEAEGESGILTAYEVAGLDMRSARLVVLSACDTGTGLALRGQEVQGLRWGFRAAGARALVSSLWRSNDAATRRMMRAFYEALVSEELPADPLRGAEALRRAKLAQLESERRLGIRRPLIWANFIFSGVL